MTTTLFRGTCKACKDAHDFCRVLDVESAVEMRHVSSRPSLAQRTQASSFLETLVPASLEETTRASDAAAAANATVDADVNVWLSHLT